MFYALTDNGTHWLLCGRGGTQLCVSPPCHEVPKVGRLATDTSAGTRHHTLGMSAVSDDAAATSRLLSEVDVTLFRSSSNVEVTPSFCYYLISNFRPRPPICFRLWVCLNLAIPTECSWNV